MFQLGEQVEWGLHCVIVLSLAPEGTAVSTRRLAEVHRLSPTYLAKALQAMSRAGLVESIPGRSGGYRLARDAAQITFLDVVNALEGKTSFFRCTEIRRNLPSPRTVAPVCAIAATMYRAESAWREELASTSLAEVRDQLKRSPLPGSGKTTQDRGDEGVRRH